MIPGHVYKPEDFLRIAWIRKWWILVPFVVVAAGTFAVVRYLPDQYRSETLILVVPQRVPESYVRSTVTTRIEDRLQSISQQILSRTRLERVIQDFDLYASARQTKMMEDIVESMRRDIDVQIVKGDAFRVSYVSSNPRSAMQVTERLASLFIEENLRDREVLAQGTNDFLSSQLEDARRRLVEHEKKLEEYRRRYSGELPSQVDSNLMAIQNAQLQVQALVESINRDRDRRLMLERQLNEDSAMDRETPPPFTPSGAEPVTLAGITAAEQLKQTRAQLAALETRLKPEHPDIVRMKRVVAELEKKAEEEALMVPLSPDGPARAGESADPVRRRRQRALQAEIDNIDSQIAQKAQEERRLRGVTNTYQGRVEASLTRESELAELMRDYGTLQSGYTSMLAKKEDSQVAANLERRQIGEQFKILDPARLPERPFSPDRPRLSLFGAIFGLGLGAGLAALIEYRDTTLKTDEDVVAALGLPVLAAVPVMMTTRERASRRRRRLFTSVTTAATLVLSLASLLIWTWRS